MKQTAAWEDSRGILWHSSEEVNRAEENYRQQNKAKAVYALLLDRGDMSMRFIDGMACASWIVTHAVQLKEILDRP